jgi:small-conductance mechanosensitive channel
MARMGRASLILVAVLVSLSLVGIDLTVLSVFGGALGVGLGLGLQKIVSSYVSGFVILLERSLTIGDMVAVDKYSGTVTRINTRYTILRGTDGIETVVPNEMLVSAPILNYSLSDRSLRLAAHVTICYQSDIDQILRLLEEAVLKVERVSGKPAPQAFLVRFVADGLELEIGFWIADPENGRLGVVSEVNRAIWGVLQTHQISVPYPQRESNTTDDLTGSKHQNLALPSEITPADKG